MGSNKFENIAVTIEDDLPTDFPDDLPKELKDDCIANYFRCRFRDRADLLKSFDEGERKRVRHELARIKDLRQRFSSKGNMPDFELFKYRQAVWRKHAIMESEQNLGDLEERIKHMKRLDTDRAHRFRAEKRILTAVKGWPTPPETPLPATPEELIKDSELEAPKHLFSRLFKKQKRASQQPVPGPVESPEKPLTSSRQVVHPADSYRISIHEMTLRKSDTSSPLSYMTYSSEMYPLNDVLRMSEDNPLRKESKPGIIRYFQFPANNMHWIEVHPPRPPFSFIIDEVYLVCG